MWLNGEINAVRQAWEARYPGLLTPDCIVWRAPSSSPESRSRSRSVDRWRTRSLQVRQRRMADRDDTAQQDDPEQLDDTAEQDDTEQHHDAGAQDDERVTEANEESNDTWQQDYTGDSNDIHERHDTRARNDTWQRQDIQGRDGQWQQGDTRRYPDAPWHWHWNSQQLRQHLPQAPSLLDNLLEYPDPDIRELGAYAEGFNDGYEHGILRGTREVNDYVRHMLTVHMRVVRRLRELEQ